jgi:hypothetical protein
MTSSEIYGLSASVRRSIHTLAPGLLDRKLIEEYILLLDNAPAGSYAQRNAATDGWCEDILHTFGQETLGTYHKLVLLTLIQRFQGRAQNLSYPGSVRAMFMNEFAAIAAEMKRKPVSDYVHSNSEFRKDLAICRQKLIPCGIVTVEVESGIPRRFLFQKNPGNSFHFASFVFRKLGSFRPLYEMHLHRRALLQFTAAGWESCYLRIADLLQLNPDIRGVFATSWWYDPKACEASPRLSFIREPQKHGAAIFPLGHDESCTREALANAPERKRLYEAGIYTPHRHLMIWGREQLLNWAQGRTL